MRRGKRLRIVNLLIARCLVTMDEFFIGKLEVGFEVKAEGNGASQCKYGPLISMLIIIL